MTFTAAPANHTERHALVMATFQTLCRATTEGPDDLTAEALDILGVLSSNDLGALHDAAHALADLIEQELADRDDPTECANCATPIQRDTYGRPRQYCSDACRQAAYRARKQP